MSLKCWVAGSVFPFEFEHVEAVFAHSHREARKVVWKQGEWIQEECDGEFTQLRLTRKPEFDFLAAGDEAYVVRGSETLRRMGWRLEGDVTCGSCGLAEFDGEFPVCPECNQCAECSCDDECAVLESPQVTA